MLCNAHDDMSSFSSRSKHQRCYNRHLNGITFKDKYPLPVVDELLDELARTKWFTKLDLNSGYHHMRLACANVFKAVIKTHQGLYEFKVMLFGLTNALAPFRAS